ncbi:type-F conjugative transfer system pilin assembly protein TrbC [Ferrovum myxofaciens]|uniref:type-F conjugative transfer system pilin assembly protein TrbC n=1 Tax=Ferrovum myxofaciens TaxID=416213 RepID=UPI003EBC32AC
MSLLSSASIGAWSDPVQPTLPSDAAINAAMQTQQVDLAKTMDMANKAGPLPKQDAIKTENLSIPSFMQKKGFGGVAPLVASVKDQLTNQMKKERTLMVAVTLSMPNEMLIDYAKQAKEAGAVLVLRGLPTGDTLPLTEARIAKLNRGVNATWNIDPTLFRKFKIDKVPSTILVDDYAARKMELSCAPDVSYLRVDGEVSIRQALAIMSHDKSDLGHVAQKRLDQIETQIETQSEAGGAR